MPLYPGCQRFFSSYQYSLRHETPTEYASDLLVFITSCAANEMTSGAQGNVFPAWQDIMSSSFRNIGACALISCTSGFTSAFACFVKTFKVNNCVLEKCFFFHAFRDLQNFVTENDFFYFFFSWEVTNNFNRKWIMLYDYYIWKLVKLTSSVLFRVWLRQLVSS